MDTGHNRHYVRLGEGNVIVHAFSNAFEQPEPLDVCVEQNAGRHYHLDLRDETGRYGLKWNPATQQIEERTEEEIEPLADYVQRHMRRLAGEAHEILGATDWVIVRHKEDVDGGGTPSMTAEDYDALRNERDAARDLCDTLQSQVENMTDRAAIRAVSMIESLAALPHPMCDALAR